MRDGRGFPVPTQATQPPFLSGEPVNATTFCTPQHIVVSGRAGRERAVLAGCECFVLCPSLCGGGCGTGWWGAEQSLGRAGCDDPCWKLCCCRVALNLVLSTASLQGWFTRGERCLVLLIRDWTSGVAPGRVKTQDNYLQAPVKRFGRLRLIPARDSLAPGRQIPIVCKCQGLYLKRGSELGAGIPHVLGGLC